MKAIVTKEWLKEQDDLYLTELAALIMREKARREQIANRLKRYPLVHAD